MGAVVTCWSRSWSTVEYQYPTWFAEACPQTTIQVLNGFPQFRTPRATHKKDCTVPLAQSLILRCFNVATIALGKVCRLVVQAVFFRNTLLGFLGYFPQDTR